MIVKNESIIVFYVQQKYFIDHPTQQVTTINCFLLNFEVTWYSSNIILWFQWASWTGIFNPQNNTESNQVWNIKLESIVFKLFHLGGMLH